MRAASNAQSSAAHFFTRAAALIAASIALYVLSATAYAQSCSPPEPRGDSGAGFTPFGASQQALARGGNKGPAWEWAVGTDTDAGQHMQGSLDWVSGKVYSWKLINSGAGSAVLEIRDEGDHRLSLSYPSGMDAGNALELRVSTNPSIGPETTIEARLASLNGYRVPGLLSQSGDRAQSAQALYYYYPQMAQGFTADGTISLTFPSKPPTGSRVQFTARAGTIPCSSAGAAPTVSITDPTSNSAFTAPTTVTVKADAQDSDGTVAQVVFFANGAPLGTATTSPFEIQWANVQAGAYSLTAVATDNDGLQTTSAAVPITVGAARALYFIHVDHLNTPRLVADATGTTVWRWDQAEPFGSNPANIDPDGDGAAFDLPLRLAGQRYDAESGLHYNYFRDYDPSLGIYKQSDPIGLGGGSLSTYVYANSNVVAATDPIGLWSTRAHNAIIGTTFPGLQPIYLREIMGGSADVDAPSNQIPVFGNSFQHAMRDPGQTVEEAKSEYCKFVQSNFLQYLAYKDSPNQKLRLRAYRRLGMALHAVMDSTAPDHRGFQEWHLSDFLTHGTATYSNEDLNRLPPYLAETVNLINALMSGQDPCPCAK